MSNYQFDPAESFDDPGLNLDDFETLTTEEINDELIHSWKSRGPLYQMFSNALMLDYGGPGFAKFHKWASSTLANPIGQPPDRENGILYSVHTLTSYVMLGWETGILNQFNVLRMRGMPKEQTMELVMFSQLYAGMRGLGHVYRAVGDLLPAMSGPPIPLEVPDGWAADPQAFKSGLDVTTPEMTTADVANLTAWYESTIGYVPDSIHFGIKYHPDFLKPIRLKWEVAIRTLPKQFAPHLMLRQSMMSGSVDGLREAVLLGKGWGMSRKQIVNGISNSVMFFTGFDGYYTAFKAVDDILDSWS